MIPWICTLLGILILLLQANESIGTQISLKTKPGSLFSIPLEFSKPKFSRDAPQWIKYEAGHLKGIAGEVLGIHKFGISEQDGTEEVTVHIAIIPRDSGTSTEECFHQKYYGRALNLHEKITFGIPGGYFTQDNGGGSILHYPSTCTLERKRRGRASVNDFKSTSGDNENLEMGSGDEEFDDDGEDEDEEYGEEEIEPHNHPMVPLQPTPAVSMYHLPEVTNILSQGNVGNTPKVMDMDTSLVFIKPTPSSDVDILHSSNGQSFDEHLPLEIGSGDFEIQPTTPIPVTPSSTPEIQFTPTLPPEQPILKKLIEKLILPAGKVFKFNVANGYFSSPHPIVYFLQESEKDGILPNWLTLEDGVLIAWPSVADISDYTINLVAQDTVTNGATVNEIFLNVRQSQKSRSYNHEWELKVLTNITHIPSEPLYKVIEKLQGFAGGRAEGDLVLTKIERTTDIISIRWINESLLAPEFQHKCPVDELKEIYLRLVNASGSSSPSNELYRQLSPSYIPKSIGIHLLANTLCAVVKPYNITGVQQHLPTTNFPPQIKPLDSIFTTSGEFFVLRVPETFCYDPEDGQTPFLNLKLYTSNAGDVPKDNWLQFDEKNQEFYGLPPPLESGKPQIEEYTLSCSDKKGKSENDALEVEISPSEKMDYAAEFRIHFRSTAFNASEIRKFMERLGKALNETMQNFLIISYQTSSAGDVQFRWHLKRNPSTEAELTQLRRIILRDDGSVTNSFKDAFAPDFNVTFGQIIPRGRLLGINTHIHDETAETDVVTEELPTMADDGRAYLITFIIPAVLIGIMVILALLFACLLSRKKKSLPRSSEEAKAFIKKGVPVIFQDELEEDRGARSRSPAILRDEHPPLPPEYRRSPILREYQPPPPMMGSRMGGPRGGVRPGTHYRKPPPYHLPP